MTPEIDSVAPVGSAEAGEFPASREKPARVMPTAGAAAGKPVTPRPARRPTQQDIQRVVQRANEHLASVNRVLQLRIDAATGLTVATISDARTGEILAQAPTADSLLLAAMLAEWSPGKHLLLDLLA